jgi:hypothetical protein
VNWTAAKTISPRLGAANLKGEKAMTDERRKQLLDLLARVPNSTSRVSYRSL